MPSSSIDHAFADREMTGNTGDPAGSAFMDNDPQYPFARDLFEEMAVIDYRSHSKTPAKLKREASKIIVSDALLKPMGGDHYATCPLLNAHAGKAQ